MSALELLKQVKGMPAREREKFLRAVLTLEEKSPAHSGGKTRRVKWPDVEARARRIFGDRVLPNLVLLEREEAVEVGQLRAVVQRGDEGGEEFREHQRCGNKPAQGNALGRGAPAE